MEIKHEDQNNRFCIYDEGGARIGEIEYMKGGSNELFATHTGVRPEYEGQGLAAKLLDALADWAREDGQKIVPICGYVVSSFKRNPEKYADVMK